MNLTEPGQYPEKHHRLWLVWFACCLFFNFPLGTGIYGSQVFIVGVLAVWIFRNLLLEGGIRLLLLVLAVLAFFIWELLITSGNPRFLPEFAKVLLLVVLLLATRDLLSMESVTTLLWVLPNLVTVLVVVVYLTGRGDYYDPLLHRFGVPEFGSPNTTAYVLAFCLILLHYYSQRSPVRARRFLTWFTYGILGLALVGTQSRGGCLIYLTGLFTLSGKRVRVILLAASSAAVLVMLFTSVGDTVSRLNLVQDLSENGGTGRLIIWQQLGDNLVEHPWSWLAGMGPGAVDLYIPGGTTAVESTHSMLVEIVYSYGLIGAAIFLWTLVRLWQKANHDSGNASLVPLKRALFLSLLVSFVFDTYPPTAQILWFTPFLVFLITGPARGGAATSASLAMVRLARTS